MSFLNKFKQLDVYRDVPKDLTKQTVTGAAVSVICTLFITYLFVTEFVAFTTLQTAASLYVDAPDKADDDYENIKINLNMTLHRVPCAVLSVDVQDVMGTHVVDVHGKLLKSRLDSAGKLKLGSDGQQLEPEGGAPEEQLGEGCNVHGWMMVKKVPGNFHVSCHAHAELINVFFQQESMNVSHTIHHLSFGPTIKLNAAKATNPLNGVFKAAAHKPKANSGHDHGHGHDDEEEDEDYPLSYEYYIKIVPTTFEYQDGSFEHSYQFVANSNEIMGHYRLPAIYFRYDLSPITMKFKNFRTPFSHFLVQVCAIVGGVFTVLGIVNSVLHQSLEHVLKKAQINKLG